jgi:hypothetical protein
VRVARPDRPARLAPWTGRVPVRRPAPGRRLGPWTPDGRRDAIATVYELALKFVLADSRVHVANVGTRWPAEVDRNCDLVESFEPPTDMAAMPRLTAGVYAADHRSVRG